jgi:hypothetical protein
MTIMGAAALQSTMAQQISNNRLLRETDHGATSVSAEAKVVGLVFPMMLSLG